MMNESGKLLLNNFLWPALTLLQRKGEVGWQVNQGDAFVAITVAKTTDRLNNTGRNVSLFSRLVYNRNGLRVTVCPAAYKIV